ncbi:carbonic anhydrase [Salinispora tropica]|uniref:Carbonic anhydrase n=1 Tax=Salinispora tropica (strain ATCC BAA-916 / DSM 44818 / JCM 13857 / NBRC 105044 / CNB-440) TaxID=369723 RepID=A4X227_SALTO|nr:carbonic anhydrase [Salinispora tropica]ABP52927.1 carbonic anhydrase [Salinispora tropica CNB-440]
MNRPETPETHPGADELLSAGPSDQRKQPVSPQAAVAELYAGNRRFAAGAPVRPHQDVDRRIALADGQQPFAVILGCSDSRLAVELIFDRGLGDLFVVRTAGHSVGSEVLGSVEYAVTVLGAPLVVVLGHDSCGAVQAARSADATGVPGAGHLRAVVEAVLPSVRRAEAAGVSDLDRIVDLHVEQTVAVLLDRSAAVAAAVAARECAVVGMSYQLTTGSVRTVTEVGLAASSTPPET